MRRLAVIALGLSGLALSACQAVSAPDRSYSLGEGIVSYDDLRRAGDKCKAEVARVSLKDVVMSVLPAGASLSSAATKQIANQLANQLGGENNHDVSSIQISGWMALVALASLATLIGYGVYTWFKKSQRSSKAYTVVDATR